MVVEFDARDHELAREFPGLLDAVGGDVLALSSLVLTLQGSEDLRGKRPLAVVSMWSALYGCRFTGKCNGEYLYRPCLCVLAAGFHAARVRGIEP